jgi:hypothetical protein
MGQAKKTLWRFAPLLAEPDGTKPLFGTRLRQALETIKKARNQGKTVTSEPGAPR